MVMTKRELQQTPSAYKSWPKNRLICDQTVWSYIENAVRSPSRRRMDASQLGNYDDNQVSSVTKIHRHRWELQLWPKTFLTEWKHICDQKSCLVTVGKIWRSIGDQKILVTNWSQNTNSDELGVFCDRIMWSLLCTSLLVCVKLLFILIHLLHCICLWYIDHGS